MKNRIGSRLNHYKESVLECNEGYKIFIVSEYELKRWELWQKYIAS